MKKKVLVSLTTPYNPDWYKTILDLKKFDVTEFGLFITTIKDSDERWQIYREIKSVIPNANIPLVHIRQGVAPDELGYLIENFGTKYFNFHPVREFALEYDYTKYLDKILIENGGPAIEGGLEEYDIDGFAGICLDLAHLERARLVNPAGYNITKKTLGKYTLLANHISAVSLTPVTYGGTTHSYDIHEYSNLTQFDYLKHYAAEYFSDIVCLELINDTEEQLKAKEYIESIIADKLN